MVAIYVNVAPWNPPILTVIHATMVDTIADTNPRRAVRTTVVLSTFSGDVML